MRLSHVYAAAFFTAFSLLSWSDTTKPAPAAKAEKKPETAKIVSIIPKMKGMIEIPFDLKDEEIVVRASMTTLAGDKVSGRFMFDTGYSGDITCGDRLNLGAPTGSGSAMTHTGLINVDTYTVKSLQLGGLKVNRVEVMGNTIDLTDDEGPVDGLIGLSSWWEGNVLEVNYQEHKLRLYPRPDPDNLKSGEGLDLTKLKPDNKTTWYIPFDPTSSSGSISVPVTLNGKVGKMILDTGNIGSFCVLYQHSATDWNILEKKPKFVSESRDASGSHGAYHVYLKNLDVGPIHVPSASGEIIDSPSTSHESWGALGSSFLQKFNIWIDFRGRQLFFQRWDPTSFAPTKGGIGIYGIRQHPYTKQYVVVGVMKESPATDAGIKDLDVIIRVNGKDVTHTNYRQIEKQFYGKPGDKIKLVVDRGGTVKEIELTYTLLINGTPPADEVSPKVDDKIKTQATGASSSSSVKPDAVKNN